MKINFLAAILIFALLSSGCKTSNSDSPALQIGNYKLTADDVLLKRKSQKYQALSDQAFENKLIEDGRMLAFAMDHKYDTVSTLNKLLEYASSAYAAKMDGFVWNKKVKPKLQVTEKDIKDAYLKRKQELMLQIIQFKDKSTLDKYYSSPKDFSSLTKKSSDPNIKVLSGSARSPYYPLSIYTNKADTAKAGDVLGPFDTENGYIIVRVEAIRPIAQKHYEQEKAMIKQELLSVLTQKYAWEKQKEIWDAATPELNIPAIKALTLKFNAEKKSFPGIDPGLSLMTFTFDGKRVPFSVASFTEFVNNAPVFYGSLTNPEDVKKILRSIVTDQYLFAEAKRMNITKDPEYLQFRKNYQERIFTEYYKRKYLYPELTVSPDESAEYYRKYSNNFKGFESATVVSYKFKEIHQAFQGRMLLTKRTSGPMPAVNNGAADRTLLPEAQTLEIKSAGQQNDPKLIKAVMALTPGQISPPVEVNGAFLVLVLSAKNGLVTLPYEYVEEKIKELLYAEKEKQVNGRLTAELERKYPTVKNTIKEQLSKIKNDKDDATKHTPVANNSQI